MSVSSPALQRSCFVSGARAFDRQQRFGIDLNAYPRIDRCAAITNQRCSQEDETQLASVLNLINADGIGHFCWLWRDHNLRTYFN